MLVNIHDAKTNFSKLINKVLNGDDIIIARDGKPLARLIPYTEDAQERHGGQLRGLIQISDDFDAPLPDDVLKQFYQGDE
jgi:prevent-host-death family protein